MMIRTLAWLFAGTLLMLGGCAVHTPSGSVVVDPHTHSHPQGQGNGTFCPPGQAKKGRC